MTADPFEAARVMLRKARELKPVQRPDVERAEALVRRINWELAAERRRELLLPDDFTNG